MVGLSVALGEVGVWGEDGGAEGQHDVSLDCFIRWAMVLYFVVWVKQFPCCLVIGVVG